MKFRSAHLLLCLAIAGCQLGPRISKFEPARRPEGITAIIELREGIVEPKRLTGELLEVQEQGLLLNTHKTRDGVVIERRLVFVPYTAMEDVDFDQLSLRVLTETDQMTKEQTPPSARDRERLRLLSRFPQGLSTALLKQLLAAEGQTAVHVISGD